MEPDSEWGKSFGFGNVLLKSSQIEHKILTFKKFNRVNDVPWFCT